MKIILTIGALLLPMAVNAQPPSYVDVECMEQGSGPAQARVIADTVDGGVALLWGNNPATVYTFTSWYPWGGIGGVYYAFDPSGPFLAIFVVTNVWLWAFVAETGVGTVYDCAQYQPNLRIL